MKANSLFSFTTIALLAVLSLCAASPASAQRRGVAAPNRSVQAVPPAEGTTAWGPQDNCLYKFQHGTWYRQDICRIMQGRSVYVTYSLSTGQRLGYYDESEAGWIKGRSLTTPNAQLLAFPTVAGRSIMVLINDQWVDFAQLIAAASSQQGGATGSISCGTQPCTSETVRTVNGGITSIPQIGQGVATMPGPPAVLR